MASPPPEIRSRARNAPPPKRHLVALLLSCSVAVTSALGQETTPAASSPPAPKAERSPVGELRALYDARDYFTLDERLRTYKGEITPEVRLLQAAVMTAFNQPRRSIVQLEPLAEDASIAPGLRQQVQLLLFRNHLRLHEYDAAYRAGIEAARLGRVHEETPALPGVLNSLRMLRVLRDTEPQLASIGGRTTLRPVDGRYPVRISDRTRLYTLDSGANYSVMMQSEAKGLDLDVLDVGLEVGTSTDIKVTADIAVAPAMQIGSVEYRHVVFLVFPDELLTIDENTRLEGIIGFPVLEAMGEIRFGTDGEIEIPAKAPVRSQRNLALEELMPLVRVEYGGVPLVARFDTGANRTQAYEPFFRRFRERIEAEGERHETKTAGVGGIRTIPAYRLPTFTFDLAGSTIALEDIDVFIESITSEESNYIHVNIGLDALEPFDGYVISFRDMALILN